MSKPAKDVRSSISEMIAFSTSSKIAFGVKKYRVVFVEDSSINELLWQLLISSLLVYLITS